MNYSSLGLGQLSVKDLKTKQQQKNRKPKPIWHI